MLDIPIFSKGLIHPSCGWSVMGKGSDPCGWFVGGCGRRGSAAILPAAGSTSPSEFRKSFEIPHFSVELLSALCVWSVSNKVRGLRPWSVGGRCFRGEGGITMVKF